MPRPRTLSPLPHPAQIRRAGDSGAIARYLRFVPDMAADEARLLLRDARPRGRS